MAPDAARRLATAEDLRLLDPAVRAEVVAGEVVEKATPSAEHADAQLGLGTALRGPFHRRGGGGAPGGWWILVECEIELEAHEVYRPDLSGWRRDRVPERPSGLPVRLRPDWVCEVLSPTTADRDLGEKMQALHRNGVPHYWIVDPLNRVLTVYRWAPDGYLAVRSAGPGDRIRAEPFDAVPLQVGLLFGEEPEE